MAACVTTPRQTVYSTPINVQTITNTITRTITTPGAPVTETYYYTQCIDDPDAGRFRRLRRQLECPNGTTVSTSYNVLTGVGLETFTTVDITYDYVTNRGDPRRLPVPPRGQPPPPPSKQVLPLFSSPPQLRNRHRPPADIDGTAGGGGGASGAQHAPGHGHVASNVPPPHLGGTGIETSGVGGGGGGPQQPWQNADPYTSASPAQYPGSGPGWADQAYYASQSGYSHNGAQYPADPRMSQGGYPVLPRASGAYYPTSAPGHTNPVNTANPNRTYAVDFLPIYPSSYSFLMDSG
ncbi:hypothetical protein M407DRAFT_4145 [Tulasnella calospora MUT 4182]|uniref:Uncharacterized protein n=1 Tax=Tulasnella calospora MUT 4182 TaxID=1051891 RepID=A0A0C3MHG6_9AGAM|nr:hypothetical protein M407DRAFT_4145 [Tulasnella calospora MUT 4182]